MSLWSGRVPRGWQVEAFAAYLDAQAADRLSDAWVETGPRGWDKPSDHTPVWVDLAV